MTDDELAALLEPKIERPPAICILDIERLPGVHQEEFWDLGGKYPRRIRPENVLEWPRTICAAWRWYGTERVQFKAEWGKGGNEAFLRRMWDVYHRADIVVGHNINKFDTKKLKSGWDLLGMTPPRPWKTVDTLTVARSEFGYESNTLDSLCERLGIGGKTRHYDPVIARAAVNGDREAQREIALYNKGDVTRNEALYDRWLPWIPNHPNLGLWSGEEKCCPRCGSLELLADGWARTALTAYAQYRCARCGGWSRPNFIKARVQYRPVR